MLLNSKYFIWQSVSNSLNTNKVLSAFVYMTHTFNHVAMIFLNAVSLIFHPLLALFREFSKMQYYDSKSQLDGSEFGSQSAFEMHPWPSHYSSQASIAPSYKSYLSTYTPSQASFFILPVTSELPNEQRRAQDNFGIAFLSLLINPIFGVAAILLSGTVLNLFTKAIFAF